MPESRAARIAELVKSALERGAEQWPSFLDEACPADPAMRAEIESLLRHQVRARDFIEGPALDLAVEALAGAGKYTAGAVLGDYEIVSLIGEGGMGEVYLAHDRSLGRHVALKLVQRGMGTEEIIHRFKREERLLASLNHPNIAQLYGGGLSPEGGPFFAMEYVDGIRIDDYCNKQRLSLRARLELFRKVCAAIHYAHQHLVIHRDIKPSNILVTETGEPKLLDFGIGKLLDPGQAAESEPTLTMVAAMTPEYASPEHIRAEAVTTASDTYSLGVLLYELLTGQRPYRIKTRRPDEIARLICETEPAKPSTAAKGRDSKTEIRDSSDSRFTLHDSRTLRGDLDNIILMALRKEPARRYSSAAQFSEDIRRYLDGLPVIARKDTFGYRSAKFVKRNRIGVAAAAVVLLTLIGAIVATAWQARVARRQRDVARLETAKAERINTFLQDMVGFSNPSWYSPNTQKGGDVTISQILEEIGPRIETELADQPEVRAEMERTIGTTYMYRARYDLAERYVGSALQTFLKLYGEEHPQTARSLLFLAEVKYFQGDVAAADQLQRRSLAVYRKEQQTGNVEPRWFAAILSDSALIASAKGDAKSAEALVREGLVVGANLTGGDRATLAIMGSVLGSILADQGKLDEAEQLHRSAIAEFHQLPGRERPELGSSLVGLGEVLTTKGELAEADASLREAEAIHRRSFGDTSPFVASSLLDEAYVSYLQGDYVQAEERANGSLSILKQLHPEGSPRYLACWRLLGRIMSRTGRAAEAEPLLRKVLDQQTRSLPEGNNQIASTKGALGECLTAQKRYPEAETLLLDDYNTLKSKFGEHDVRLKRIAQLLAELYDAWDKPEQAARYR
jgi:eukaryotic-like serine/threonine-protein kinase